MVRIEGFKCYGCLSLDKLVFILAFTGYCGLQTYVFKGCLYRLIDTAGSISEFDSDYPFFMPLRLIDTAGSISGFYSECV